MQVRVLRVPLNQPGETMEEWRDIVGYIGYYQVSNLGRVRSRDRVVPHSHTGAQARKGVLLGLAPNRHGRLQIRLHRDGGGQVCRVHRLVAAAFHGPCPAGMECCHNDGDKLNNHASNLRWDTPEANRADRTAHGVNQGERGGAAKLTRGQVVEIRQALTTSSRCLARQYGVARSTIRDIRARKTWSHLP